MKLIWIAAIIVLSGSVSPAQGRQVTGSWQGTMQADGSPVRLVLKISKTETGSLRAMLYNADTGGTARQVSEITTQGVKIRFSIVAIAASYEGSFSADGNSITGTWRQQGTSMPLDLVLATVQTEWTIPEGSPAATPMAADADPAFEVATIKPSSHETSSQGFRTNGRNFSTTNTPLTLMLEWAYGLHSQQIAGGPAWTQTDDYDVAAIPDAPGSPSNAQVRTMLQKLLTERFHLTFHFEKKELTVYAISVAKGGSKLTPSEGDPNARFSLRYTTPAATLPARNATMVDFAGSLQRNVLDRPVIDRTGLVGKFDFTLTWKPDETQFGGGLRAGSDDADSRPDLFVAMQQQLGLKLEAVKAMVDVMVIDQVTRPSEN